MIDSRMYNNIICLHEFGLFYNILDFFHLVEDTQVSAFIYMVILSTYVIVQQHALKM